MLHLGKSAVTVKVAGDRGTHLWFRFVRILPLVILLLAVLMANTGSLAQSNSRSLTLQWDANSEADLAGYKVHAGFDSRNYHETLDLGLAREYTFNNLEDNRTYHFAVTAYDTAGNESGYSEEVSHSFTTRDTEPPELNEVAAVDLNTLALTFSEALARATAENKANYAIVPARAIHNAELDENGTTVTLTTEDHVGGQTYTLSVQHLADLADPPNLMAPTSRSYAFAGGDRAAPVVTYAGVVSATGVELRFDEPVDQSSAEQLSNYQITPALTIRGAALHNDERGVHLTTDAHQDGQGYRLVIRNIRDQAAPPNTMSDSAVYEYTFQAEDRQGPRVTGVKLLDLTTLRLSFDERLDRAVAETTANYRITGGIEVRFVELNTEATAVTLLTSAHELNRDYTITLNNLRDVSANGNTIASDTQLQYRLDGPERDTSPPEVTYAHLLDATTLEVRFSEPVNAASATAASHYQIDRGVRVINSLLHADNRGVHLRTTPHSDGVGYNLTVSEISDRADILNIMPIPVSLPYTYVADDIQPPRIVGIAAVDLTTIEVSFNEHVGRVSAENVLNYQITEGIQVLTASLTTDRTQVTLRTTPHEYDFTYSLTVNGIVDESPNQNILSAPVTLQYRLVGPGTGQNGGLLVNDLNPTQYRLDTLRVGATYYTDRDYRVVSVPRKLEGMTLIRTADRDRRNRAESFLEFNLNRDVDVYLAYDNRALAAPDWLATNFVRTNMVVFVSSPSEWMQVWRGHFTPGHVQLGGNMASGAQNDGTLEMYFVLLDDLQPERGTTGDGGGVAKMYELFPNYPNPFSLSSFYPRTLIKYNLQQEGRVVVRIYNMLGQTVRTLQDGTRSPGEYTLFWDGRDDNLQSVPSGNYVYSLEIREQLSNGDITLTTAVERQTRMLTLLK